MERKSFNELLKEKELLENKQHQDDGHLALDDAKRVKVLSPGQLVFKRFIRNKLAIFGTCVLIFMQEAIRALKEQKAAQAKKK